MVTPTTTVRLTEVDRARLQRLADELVCSRADALRLGMAALFINKPLRRQIRADNLAIAFLQSLRTQYGPNAVIELVDGPEDPQWQLAGKPLGETIVDVVERRQGDRWVLDLIDRSNGVVIRNALSWEDEDGHRHAVVALKDLWVHVQHRVTSEPRTRRTLDGRTVLELTEDDGTSRLLVIDDQGNSRPVDAGTDTAIALPSAEPPPVSNGVGVRRESVHGPHVGRGYGGTLELTGDLDRDRSDLVTVLRQLIDRAEQGELDDLLDPTALGDGEYVIEPFAELS